MENIYSSNSAGLPGLALIGIGTFLKVQTFLPETLSGWLMAGSYAGAIVYYAIKIYNEYKSK
jgi:hypothetical protein